MRAEDHTGAGRLTVADEPEPGASWDAFVKSSRNASYGHLSAWRGLMSEVLGHEPHYLTARDEGDRVRGVLPLVEVRSLLFGHFLVSMPFLSYGGPLGSAEARALLAESAIRRARERGADLLELRSRSGGEAPEGVGPSGAVPEEMVVTGRKIVVVLPLPDDPETLWEDGLRSKVRSQVRRPMKEGIEVRFGPEQIGPFYEVFARHMRDLGTPVLPLRFFEALAPAFGGQLEVACAYRGEEPVAAGVGFYHDREFEITWAAALREHRRVAPNMLLYWRLMEKAIERGASAFNFGRCSPGAGTHRFKKQWGGEDEPLPWAAWSSDGHSAATPTPDEGRYRLATQVWSRLPVGVTRTLGPPLARCIP